MRVLHRQAIMVLIVAASVALQGCALLTAVPKAAGAVLGTTLSTVGSVLKIGEPTATKANQYTSAYDQQKQINEQIRTQETTRKNFNRRAGGSTHPNRAGRSSQSR